MADEALVKILRQGAEVWNQWRRTEHREGRDLDFEIGFDPDIAQPPVANTGHSAIREDDYAKDFPLTLDFGGKAIFLKPPSISAKATSLHNSLAKITVTSGKIIFPSIILNGVSGFVSSLC